MARESAGFKNGQSQGVVALLCLAKLDPLKANEEDAVGDLVGGTAIGGVEADELAFHATPAFWPRFEILCVQVLQDYKSGTVMRGSQSA